MNKRIVCKNVNNYLPTVSCKKCHCNVEYTIYEEQNIIEEIDGEKVAFIGKAATCKICNSEVFPEDIFEENKENINKAYRLKKKIILIEEIKQLLSKYNIGATVLSEILGWSKVTISKYEGGRTPSKKHSDTLYDLLNNPFKMRELVIANKSIMKPVAYNKIIESIDKE